MAEDETADYEKPTVADPRAPTSSSMRAMPPPGARIGRYVVERPLGTGGMGVVVAARHEQLGELVAIKLMHAKAAKNTVQAERFAREAKQTVRIKSERVVRVLDAGTDDGTGASYIVMEYLEGRDLGRVLSEDGPLEPARCADLMLQVCEAVAAAHALGIVHRDLKPSNFFLAAGPDGSPLVKVLDLSKPCDAISGAFGFVGFPVQDGPVVSKLALDNECALGPDGGPPDAARPVDYSCPLPEAGP